MLLFGLCLVLSNVLLDATLSPDMDILPGILKTLGLPKNKLLRYEVYKEQIRNGALSCNRINDHEFHVKFRGLGRFRLCFQEVDFSFLCNLSL